MIFFHPKKDFYLQLSVVHQNNMTHQDDDLFLAGMNFHQKFDF